MKDVPAAILGASTSQKLGLITVHYDHIYSATTDSQATAKARVDMEQRLQSVFSEELEEFIGEVRLILQFQRSRPRWERYLKFEIFHPLWQTYTTREKLLFFRHKYFFVVRVKERWALHVKCWIRIISTRKRRRTETCDCSNGLYTMVPCQGPARGLWQPYNWHMYKKTLTQTVETTGHKGTRAHSPENLGSEWPLSGPNNEMRNKM